MRFVVEGIRSRNAASLSPCAFSESVCLQATACRLSVHPLACRRFNNDPERVRDLSSKPLCVFRPFPRYLFPPCFCLRVRSAAVGAKTSAG